LELFTPEQTMKYFEHFRVDPEHIPKYEHIFSA
jgi:hypothetical protein